MKSINLKKLSGNKCKLKSGKLIYTICGWQPPKYSYPHQLVLHHKKAGNKYKLISFKEFNKKWILV